MPNEDGRYWSTEGAILMLALGAILLGFAMAPLLPARARAVLGVDAPKDLANVHEWIGGVVLPGLTAVAFGVGVFLSDAGYFLVMIVVTVGYWFGVVRPSQRAREGPAKPTDPNEHRVEVHDVRPLPDEEDPYERYYIALCECGWVGEAFAGSAEAFEEARRHSPHVAEDMRRPVG